MKLLIATAVLAGSLGLLASDWATGGLAYL